MIERKNEFLLFVSVVAIAAASCFVAGFAGGKGQADLEWQDKLIKVGLAGHNSQTGKFELKIDASKNKSVLEK